MKFSCLKGVISISLILLLSGLSLQGASPTRSEKITADEVVTKHLESIGTAAVRSSVTSRIIQGSVVTTMRIGGSGQSSGGSVMASQGIKSLMGLVFGSQEYSNEKMAFNGSKVTFGELRPGERTHLGGFLLNHDMVFKEGLIGGTLSSAWPLLDLQSRNPKLKYAGTKKINDRQCHVLKYESRKGGNLEIRLYFDAETFRHVRTDYEQTFLPPPVTTPSEAARQKETHLKFVEDFSDFRVEGDLTLPHTYKIQLSFDGSNNPLLQDWVLTLTKFHFNQRIADEQFDVAGK